MGLRRRGYPASAIREFCDFIGVSRTNSRHQVELLESFVRTELNRVALRRMAVLRPLRVVITNWPVDDAGEPVVEFVELNNNPENADDGTRMVPFSGVLYIEQDDFMAEPPPKYFRLSPGKEVRLRGAYFVTATGFDTDADGNVVEVQVTYDPETRGRQRPGRSQGQVDDALGLRGSRGRRDRCALRPAVHARGARARRPATRSTT